MLDALKRFHNAQEMLDEQSNMSSHTYSRILNLKKAVAELGNDFSEVAVKEINDRVDELIVESGVLTNTDATVMLSPHSLKALGFLHTNLVAEEFGMMPGWFRGKLYIFEMLDGWKIGTGAPAKIDKDISLETLYDLNLYQKQASGKDLIVIKN